MINKPQVVIYALHMNFGGVESSLAQLANMLADDYEIELAVVYNLRKIPFKLDPRIKVTFLSKIKPNRKELKQAFIGKGNLIKEVISAGKIPFIRRSSVKKHIKDTQADVLISSRIMFHDLVSNCRQPWQVAICQEHTDPKGGIIYLTELAILAKNCDFVMPVSQFLADEFSRILKNEVKFIPHAIELPEVINYAPSKKLISIGRLSREKGFSDMIDIMKRVSGLDDEYTLDIYGDGACRAKLETKIQKLQLEDKIKIHGFQPPEVLSEALSKSGLFLTTSLEESFGLVIIESMSHGVPVISFDTARGATEIIEQGGGLIIENRSVEDMAQVIVGLTNEQALKLSAEALEVAKKYDVKEIKKQWLEFLDSAKKQKCDKMN